MKVSSRTGKSIHRMKAHGRLLSAMHYQQIHSLLTMDVDQMDVDLTTGRHTQRAFLYLNTANSAVWELSDKYNSWKER